MIDLKKYLKINKMKKEALYIEVAFKILNKFKKITHYKLLEIILMRGKINI